MSRRLVETIQSAVARGDYDVTVHAVDEMAEDGFDIFDVESAIESGEITKTETEDPRGERHTIVGKSFDRKRSLGVAGRFKETGIFLVITVFEITD